MDWCTRFAGVTVPACHEFAELTEVRGRLVVFVTSGVGRSVAQVAQVLTVLGMPLATQSKSVRNRRFLQPRMQTPVLSDSRL
jgi:hypothetical protein